MRRVIGCIVIFCCISFCVVNCTHAQNTPPSQTKKIIIIRHGEKPETGDNLSCMGFNRALQLSAVLYKKFGLPSSIFVPSINEGKKTSSARMYQTIIPFAIKYNLTINSKFEVEDAEGLAGALQKREGTSIVVWEHKNINNIVEALGVKEKVKWDGDDYDSIWIITYKGVTPELTVDKEDINPKSDCL